MNQTIALDTPKRVRATLMKPLSGWLKGCDLGDPPDGSERHYIVLCVGGPLDGQYITFHGEAPGMFVEPSGLPKRWWQFAYGGEYHRIHECEDGNDAVFVCTKAWRNSMLPFWRDQTHWWLRRRFGGWR